jgi:glycerophosphoryl diester phosphodiesterase
MSASKSRRPALALAALSAVALPAPAVASAIVQVYAHRGARAFNPENTLPAYRATLKIGADWLDMDVVLTKDGEVLISHDPVLNPAVVRDAAGHYLAADRKAVVKEMTLKELQTYDVGRLNPDSAYAKFFPDQHPADGTRMPLLRDVVREMNRVAPDLMGFQIEMKTDPSRPEISADPAAFARAVYAVLKKEGIVERAEIQAFDYRCLQELTKLDPKVKTAYLTSRENEPGGPDDFFQSDPAKAGLWTAGRLVKDHGGSFPRLVKDMGGYAWEPEDFELTKPALDEAHRLGLKVVVWSWPEKLGAAFDPELTARMIAWGVDGIITDDPGRLTSMLAARGLRVPRRRP